MSDDATAAGFGSSKDAARLAKIGAHVAARLNAKHIITKWYRQDNWRETNTSKA